MLTKADLQRLRSLRDKKHREHLGLFVVEGEKVIAELLGAGCPLLEIYATEAWKPAVTTAAKFQPVTAAEMARVSHFPTPSSVIAVGKIVRQPIAADALGHGITLALDRVQDAGNVGTVLRIADWFGVDRVILSPDCADLFHQKVINASMGSFARVHVHTTELAPLLRAAAPRVPVLGCGLEGDDIHNLASLENVVVVIGNEGRGLSSEVAATVSQRVTIPRFGRAESLNAAIAAAIACDILRRGRPVPRC